MAGGGAATGNLGDVRTQNNSGTAMPSYGSFLNGEFVSSANKSMGNVADTPINTPWGNNPQPNYFAPVGPKPIRQDLSSIIGRPMSDFTGQPNYSAPPAETQPLVQPSVAPAETQPLVQPSVAPAEPVFNIKKDYELSDDQLGGADELAQARAQADAQRMAQGVRHTQPRSYFDEAMAQAKAQAMAQMPYGASQQTPFGTLAQKPYGVMQVLGGLK